MYSNVPHYNDDDGPSVEELIYKAYKANPELFKREEYDNLPKASKPFGFDKWTLIDEVSGRIYAEFDSDEKLEAFIKSKDLKQTIKNILTDRVCRYAPKGNDRVAMSEVLDPRTICLTKGCVSAYPDYGTVCLLIDEHEGDITWDYRNNIIEEEKALADTLSQAGLCGKTFDKISDDDEMPY